MKNSLRNIINAFLVSLALVVISACEEEVQEVRPTADFTAKGSMEAFDTITFENNSLNATSFNWHFGNGITVFSQSPRFVYEQAGVYEVTLQAEGAGGRSVVTKEITIREGVPYPTASFEIENEGLLFDGVPVVFVNTSTDGESYFWEFGDNEESTSTDKDPIFTYDQAGEYAVTLTTSNRKGEDSYSFTISIVEGNLGDLYFIHNDLDINKFYVKKVNVRSKEVTDVTEIPGFSFGIEYDPSTELLYYSDDDNLKIYSNTLAGDNEQEVADGFSSVRDLALDSEFGYLYVTDRSANELVEIRLSDLRISTLYDNALDGLGELPVGIDYSTDELFVTCVEIDAESVWKGNVFGDGITRIIDYSAGGYGYSIAIDATNSKLYFDDTDAGNLKRADLDGSNIEVIAETNDRSYGIDTDAGLNKLYWSERDGNIYSSNLDGSGVEPLVEGLGDIRGIVLVK